MITGYLFIAAAAIGVAGFQLAPESASASPIRCGQARVIDGDTLDCDGRRIRLAGIDAPEMPGHCRQGRACTPGDPYASANALRRTIGAQPLQCVASATDHYGRTIARCSAGGKDLSCAQISQGFAVRRYGRILCWP